MNDFKAHSIKGIIDEVNKAQDMIDMHTGCQDNDPASAFMIKQYQGIKRRLFKELLAELMLADLNYHDIEHFMQRLSEYLKRADDATSAPKELKVHLAEMEKLMAA